jgi:hypothetical protein
LHGEFTGRAGEVGGSAHTYPPVSRKAASSLHVIRTNEKGPFAPGGGGAPMPVFSCFRVFFESLNIHGALSFCSENFWTILYNVLTKAPTPVPTDLAVSTCIC